MNRYFRVAGLFALLLTPFVSKGQTGPERRMSNWIFGNSNQSIRFNRVTGQPELRTGRALPFGAGGSVSVSDVVNGDLLFYSDGVKVYDRSHQVMPAGSGLSGNPSANQPVVACAIPGQPAKYFLFTNDATSTSGGTVRVSVVDMEQFGNSSAPAPPTGDLDPSRKNLPVTGLSGVSEGMLLVPNQDGTGYWLLTHRFGFTSFQATLVNAASFTSSTFSTTNSTLAVNFSAASHLTWHPVTGRLAVVPSVAGHNALILDFDRSTGALSLNQQVLNSNVLSTNGQAIYDAEWSPSGNYLYLSIHGDESAGIKGDVLQFNPADPTVTLASVLPAGLFRSFGLQRANDTTVYHLYQEVAGGPIRLGRLDSLDLPADSVLYTSSVLGSSDWLGKQFPSSVPDGPADLNVSFTFAGSCENNPVVFFPTVVPGADSLVWDFGDGSTSSAWSPRHTYSQGTSFNVSVRAFLGGASAVSTAAVTLQAFKLRINVTRDTTACRSEFPPPRGTTTPVQFKVEAKVDGGTAASALWSNGDNGLILTPDSAGYYYLVVSDASGCSTYAGVNVKEYDLQDQRSNVWYFGNKAGIDFNKQPPEALSDGAMNAPEGCAVIGDRNGRLIFYTDGDKVFNREHTQIASGIGGNPQSSQGVVIVSVPGDETLYYIFTTEANILGSGYTLYYSLFDLKPNNGLGAVLSKRQPLFARSTERLTSNGNWLVAHEFGNNSFRAYRVTAQGLSSPVITAIGSDHLFQPVTQAEGYMRLGPGNKLAVPISSPGISNILEVFHLVDSSGRITDYRKLDLGVTIGQAYGVEFSPGGRKLFVSVAGPPSAIVEFSIDSLDRIRKRQTVSAPGRIGAIQRAPDGQLYIAIDGSPVLGAILANEDTLQNSSFNFSSFALASGTNSRMGLPNFIQQSGNNFGGPALGFSGICLGTPTDFLGTKTDPIDNFIWAFGDGAGSTKDSVSHLYAVDSTYIVSLNVKNRCGLDTTMVRTVRISPPPDTPTIPPAIALCKGSLLLDADTLSTPGIRYRWSTGDTTRQITTQRPGAFAVQLEDRVTGCTSAAVSLVVDNRPVFDLGSDRTLCQNQSASALDVQNPGATYGWTLNGTVLPAGQRINVDTAVPGVFEYKAQVTDPITTCFRRDSVIFTIKETPSFTLTTSNTDTDCTTPSGRIDIQIAASTASFTYLLGGPITRSASGKLAGTYNESALPSGSYVVTVGNELSGCALSKTTGITDPTFTLSVPGTTTCTTAPLTMTTNAAGTYSVKLTSSAGLVTTPVTRSGSPAQTPAVPPGTYTVEISQASCKVTVSNVVVSKSGPVALSTSLADRCAASPLVSATSAAPGATFSWSGPVGTIVTPSAFATRVNPPSGTTQYKVTASAPGFCPAIDSVTVVSEGLAGQVSIGSSDICQPVVILTAQAPAGPYTFRWYRNNVLDLNFLGSQVSVDSTYNGQIFRAELFSSASGCAYPTSDKTIEVVGKLTVALTGEQACKDGNLVTLTAESNRSNASFAWFFNGLSIPGNADTIKIRPEGKYRVRASRLGCFAESELEVVRAPIPEGRLPETRIICAEVLNPVPETRQVVLDPGFFVSYEWFKNELPFGNTERVYIANSPGTFRVDLVNSFQCKGSDEVIVKNECEPVIKVPNAFRPTSAVDDNREFGAFTLFIEDKFHVFIFNRWGEMVFQSSDREFRWNGGYDNDLSRPLPGGAYSWLMEYTSTFRPQEGVQRKRGGVLLLR